MTRGGGNGRREALLAHAGAEPRSGFDFDPEIAGRDGRRQAVTDGMRALFSDAFDSRQQYAAVDVAEGYLAASGATGTPAAAAAADSP